MIPVQADIEQGECIRRDPAPYEPITYRVPLDADLQQYTAEMCDLYEVPLELAYAVMQVESGYTVSATSSTGDYGLMQIGRQDFVDAVAHLYYLPAEQMGVQ